MIGTERIPWAKDDEGYWQAILQQGSSCPPAVASQPPDEPEDWLTTPFAPREQTTAGNNGLEGELDSLHDDLEEGWQYLEHCYENGEVLELSVEGFNRGGLLVRYKGVQGFVPASQLLDMASQASNPHARESCLSRRVGKCLALKVIELDRDADRVILSERAARWEGRCPDIVIESLQPGAVTRGRVSNLCSFGAFVDLGGVDGLIHVSELSWQRVEHPRDLLRPGQEVDVYIMDVDRERKRVALSLKRLQPDPWDHVEERYQVGQLVTGPVTNVVDFGAFVQVEEGLEGLVHISELAEGNFLHPRNVVQENDIVTARIVHIDGASHRLGLSLRQAYAKQTETSSPSVGDVAPVPW
jgi:small subunit ribosomal protein S1